MFIYVVATRQFECAHKDCLISDSLFRNVDLDGERMEGERLRKEGNPVKLTSQERGIAHLSLSAFLLAFPKIAKQKLGGM